MMDGGEANVSERVEPTKFVHDQFTNLWCADFARANATQLRLYSENHLVESTRVENLLGACTSDARGDFVAVERYTSAFSFDDDGRSSDLLNGGESLMAA